MLRRHESIAEMRTKKKVAERHLRIIKIGFSQLSAGSRSSLLESETFAGENPEPYPKVTSDPDPELQI